MSLLDDLDNELFSCDGVEIVKKNGKEKLILELLSNSDYIRLLMEEVKEITCGAEGCNMRELVKLFFVSLVDKLSVGILVKYNTNLESLAEKNPENSKNDNCSKKSLDFYNTPILEYLDNQSMRNVVFSILTESVVSNIKANEKTINEL